jgi:hypothetical protein
MLQRLINGEGVGITGHDQQWLTYVLPRLVQSQTTFLVMLQYPLSLWERKLYSSKD